MRDSRGAGSGTGTGTGTGTGEGAETGEGSGAVTSPPPPLPQRPPPSPRSPRMRKRERAPVARRRLGGGAGPGRSGAERGEIHPIPRSDCCRQARGTSCPGAAGQEQSLRRGNTRPGERAPGAAPREGKRCSSPAPLPRQPSGPVPNDAELPRPGNDRRRLLRARVQGPPEAQRPGEGTGLGLCSVGPELMSGASWVVRLCQALGTRHSFGFLLAFLTSSDWH